MMTDCSVNALSTGMGRAKLSPVAQSLSDWLSKAPEAFTGSDAPYLLFVDDADDALHLERDLWVYGRAFAQGGKRLNPFEVFTDQMLVNVEKKAAFDHLTRAGVREGLDDLKRRYCFPQGVWPIDCD